jgi:hypothetical protein
MAKLCNNIAHGSVCSSSVRTLISAARPSTNRHSDSLKICPTFSPLCKNLLALHLEFPKILVNFVQLILVFLVSGRFLCDSINYPASKVSNISVFRSALGSVRRWCTVEPGS